MWRTALRVSGLCLRRQSPICRSVRLPLLPPPVDQLCVRREYSTQPPASRPIVFIGIPNPYIWLRIKAYCFVVRTLMDQDFSLEEFSAGARQAFLFVSKKLSEGKFDELENVVAKEILQELQRKCSELSDNYRKALAADSDEMMYMTPGDMLISYDNTGRKFVNILMRFWYSKDTDFLDDDIPGKKVFEVVIGNRNVKDTQRILRANYEFRREFTPGVPPEWTIVNIEHSPL
ncbi:m-AAA protease-interacting protein 1, mitochondrial [Mantella aurantiaca]